MSHGLYVVGFWFSIELDDAPPPNVFSDMHRTHILYVNVGIGHGSTETKRILLEHKVLGQHPRHPKISSAVMTTRSSHHLSHLDCDTFLKLHTVS